ncbi:MAG: preprotein translocase subunit SecG [Chitinophagales bacterium]
MYVFLTVIMIIICVLLIAVVLIQNPKGGGLGAGFGGSTSQIMGVKRTSDFLEKSTWSLVIGLLVLSLASGFFIPDSNMKKQQEKSAIEDKVNDNIPTLPSDEGFPDLGDE